MTDWIRLSFAWTLQHPVNSQLDCHDPVNKTRGFIFPRKRSHCELSPHAFQPLCCALVIQDMFFEEDELKEYRQQLVATRLMNGLDSLPVSRLHLFFHWREDLILMFQNLRNRINHTFLPLYISSCSWVLISVHLTVWSVWIRRNLYI